MMATTAGRNTRSKKGTGNNGSMGDTIAPTAIQAEKKMSQELEKAKIRMEAQADKIKALSEERDFLKEQLAASLRRHAPMSPSPMKRDSLEDSIKVKKGSSFSSSSNQSTDGFSSSSSESSEQEDRQRKKRKKKGKEKKKSKERHSAAIQRAQHPTQVVARYKKILRVLKRGTTMSAAFKQCHVDRNTIVATAPVAELYIAAPKKYSELEKNAPSKLMQFAAECSSAINEDQEIKDQVRSLKSSGQLLPLKTRAEKL